MPLDEWSFWALFVPACFALNMAPGPNNMTGFVNGARLPLGSALIASLGRLPAFAVLIGLTAIGLGAALAASEQALWIIRILGAIYLIYIGVKMLLAPPAIIAEGAPAETVVLAQQDFLVAIGNPKAIAIFTAFFPQFVAPGDDVTTQILRLGAVFLALEAVAAAIYVLIGRASRGAMRKVGGFGLVQRGVGGFLVVSGVTLALQGR